MHLTASILLQARPNSMLLTWLGLASSSLVIGTFKVQVLGSNLGLEQAWKASLFERQDGMWLYDLQCVVDGSFSVTPCGGHLRLPSRSQGMPLFFILSPSVCFAVLESLQHDRLYEP